MCIFAICVSLVSEMVETIPLVLVCIVLATVPLKRWVCLPSPESGLAL